MIRIAAALDLAGACQGDNPVDHLVERFCELAREFGFSCAANGAWHYANGTRLNRFFFNTWPADWFALYEREGLAPLDPVVTDAARSMTSFTLSERRAAWQIEAGGRRVLAVAETYGWKEVFVIPVHGPFGYQGAVSLAGLEPVTLTGAERVALEAASRAIHMRCRSERGFGVGLADRPTLTDRQLQCLRWVAVGKSDSDIALLVGIAEATVHYHVEEAKRRLGVRSRLQAVARLVLDGTL